MSKPADEPLARESFAALMAAGVVDGPLIAEALGEDSPLYRRLGAFALFGTGATVSGDERTKLVRVASRGSRLDGALRCVARLGPPGDRGERLRADRGRAGGFESAPGARGHRRAGRSLRDRRRGRAADGAPGQRAPHAAGYRFLASRGPRAGRRGEARARPRGDGDAGVSDPQRLAGPDVCGQGGGAAQGRVHAREAGLRRQRQRAGGDVGAASACRRRRSQPAGLHRGARARTTISWSAPQRLA